MLKFLAVAVTRSRMRNLDSQRGTTKSYRHFEAYVRKGPIWPARHTDRNLVSRN